MNTPDALPTSKVQTSGWIDRSDRVRIEIGGPDRAKFLHNLVTNEVKKLAVGRGCEAFITSLQGKTLAYVSLIASESSILLRTDVGEADGVLGHLNKYGVFDDVTIEDVTSATFEIHVFGEASGAFDGESSVEALSDAPLANVHVEWRSHWLRFVREAPTGRPGFTIIGPREAEELVRAAIVGGGLASEIDHDTFEAMRIEAGTPISGRDVTPGNLPQEIGRDLATISFVKGCYLGQETVARLDALGHVNKILKGLRIEGDVVPGPGSVLTASDGKAAGAVTSAAFSPGWQSSIALAYIRVAYANAGTTLSVDIGGRPSVAVVADLPMLPGVARG
jgi:folate-binding protein YgfZ